MRPKLKDPFTENLHEALEELDKMGRIHWPGKKGGVPSFIQYEDEMEGVELQSIWTDIPPVGAQALERVDYPTQKPEALLERIIKASSNEGDLVLDCFCGSGTTAAVAEKLNRKWIACDLGRFAIHTTRKRLLAIPHVKPFVVQNLGKYERQAWQAAEFPKQNQAEDQREREVRYRKFILELYHAEPVSGYTWLHGLKSGRMVHVAAVDAPVTLSDVKAMAAEIWRAVGKGKDLPKEAGIDVLGWEFAFELNELARQIAAEARVDLRFKKIPREVLEKRAVEQGDIHFFELAALTVDLKMQKKASGTVVKLKLKDFIPPHDDVPQEVLKAITHWSQWIDYWAVDWNYQGDTFHNEWQSYRTRKPRSSNESSNEKRGKGNDFVLETSHVYEKSGTYNIVVKVIDILGNDTTKTVQVEV
jgi:SAM-dependent methyltransferase